MVSNIDKIRSRLMDDLNQWFDDMNLYITGEIKFPSDKFYSVWKPVLKDTDYTKANLRLLTKDNGFSSFRMLQKHLQYQIRETSGDQIVAYRKHVTKVLES